MRNDVQATENSFASYYDPAHLAKATQVENALVQNNANRNLAAFARAVRGLTTVVAKTTSKDEVRQVNVATLLCQAAKDLLTHDLRAHPRLEDRKHTDAIVTALFLAAIKSPSAYTYSDDSHNLFVTVLKHADILPDAKVPQRNALVAQIGAEAGKRGFRDVVRMVGNMQREWGVSPG